MLPMSSGFYRGLLLALECRLTGALALSRITPFTICVTTPLRSITTMVRNERLAIHFAQGMLHSE